MEPTKTKMIKVFLVEEEDSYYHISHDINRAVLRAKAPIELLGVSSSRDIAALRKAVSKFSPDVVLLNVRELDADIIKELDQIRAEHPQIGIVLSIGSSAARNIDLLRRLALKGTGGTAFFLKEPVDRIERLLAAIQAVNQGQFILDVPLTNFMFGGKPGHPFLERLTPREAEILKLLAEGYTNQAMAGELCIDIKTVERHLNNMYAKLKLDRELGDRHLRVAAAKCYLEAIYI